MGEEITPENAIIKYYFAPSEGSSNTFTNSHGIEWNISSASMLPGEIGIHWDRENTRSSNLITPRHDVSGKISPKIYGYYAIDLLDTVAIQELTVGAKHYDHIHMVMLPESEITTNDVVKGIDNKPELKTNSMAISGTVSFEGETVPFEYTNSNTYKENDLGDITFGLSIFENNVYSVYVHHDIERLFGAISWNQLVATDGKIVISKTSNTKVFNDIHDLFIIDDVMSCTFKKDR